MVLRPEPTRFQGLNSAPEFHIAGSARGVWLLSLWGKKLICLLGRCTLHRETHCVPERIGMAEQRSNGLRIHLHP